MAAFAVSVTDFVDLHETDWFYESAKYVVDVGLYNGTSTTTFSPEMTMTRAMFITLLARYDGVDKRSFIANGTATTGVNLRSGPGTDYDIVTAVPGRDPVKVTGYDSGWYAVSYNGRSGYIRGDYVDVTVGAYHDVPYEEYYAYSVLWGYENQFLSPSGAGTFSPDEYISREDMCTALYRYALYKDVELAPALERVTFIDDGEISPDCRDAVYALQQAGLVTGNPDGSFAPRADAQRCEVAVIIHRYRLYLENASSPQPQEPDPAIVTPYIPEYFERTVPEGAAVDDTYFDDACFIGHSLAVGMQLYTRYGKADFYAVSGISADGVLNKADYEYIYIDETGQQAVGAAPLAQLLAQKSYGKVYVFLGVNELGPKAEHAETFYARMTQLVELIRETQPGAVVYLMSLTPISQEKSLLSDYFNRENALVFNGLLRPITWICSPFSATYRAICRREAAVRTASICSGLNTCC